MEHKLAVLSIKSIKQGDKENSLTHLSLTDKFRLAY